MPTFTNQPPTDDRCFALPLIRTPANGKLKLILTCADLVGCPTHWFGGRTVPCEADTCKACEEGVPWRWHAYVSGLQSATRLHVLSEFTAQATDALIQYRHAHGSLRGCFATAHRHRNRHNGRVILSCNPYDLTTIKLPQEPHIKKALAIIWNLPEPSLHTQDRQRDQTRLRVGPVNYPHFLKKETNHDVPQ